MTVIETSLAERIVTLRRDLHRYPELSWQETRTAEKVCEFLDDLGVAYRRGVAQTGVVAEIPGRQAGPLVALRADLDALPIREETELPFASAIDGVMHACGHDGHTSMLLGAAALLAGGPPPPLPVRLLWQPAEETGQGALAMIEAGVLEDVAMIFGGHLDRHYETGTIAIHEGAVNASSDTFEISIRGEGGHAARPHEAIDAVVVGSLLVMSLQTIVSREVDPAHPSVVTVGRFDAGTAANVIAGQATLKGSIRAQHAEVRAHLHASIRRIAASIGQLHDARMEVRIHEGTPPLINAGEMAALAREAAVRALGADAVVEMRTANMGGEDFAHYLDHVPGCYVRFGSRFPDRENYPAHSSRFDFDEDALAIGAAYYRSMAVTAGEELSR